MSPPAATPPAPATPAHPPETVPEWQKTTLADIDREIDFTRVPPDSGVVVPIAPADEEPEPEVAAQLETLQTRLPDWPPGKVPDVVQRARNLLYVAAVPDVLQTPIERFAPRVIYERLQEDIPAAAHSCALLDRAAPDGRRRLGRAAAADPRPELRDRRPDETRNRAAFYAVKLLGRLTGRIKAM